jgi:hypothetical protein
VKATLLWALFAACGTPPETQPAAAPPVLEHAVAITDPPPPPAPEAWTEELNVASAPFETPSGAPSVIVHAGPAFDRARPLRLVVFLHGWTGCARMLMLAGEVPCRDGERAREGWDLAGRFDESGSDALFVIPQLAFLVRDGSAGRFVEEGRFRAFVSDMLGRLSERIGSVGVEDVESIAILAHSAGYESALAVIGRGGVEIDRVVLFDALYRGVEPFLSWAGGDPDRRLISLYTGEGRTARQSEMLGARSHTVISGGAVAVDAPGSIAEQARTFRVVIARSPAPHGLVPARHIPELLDPLGFGGRE